MIEVFKTNIETKEEASRLIGLIQRTFQNHQANFDLQDCDNILRICSTAATIEPVAFIHFLQQHGCMAEVLPD